ncbi:hypothetical protein ACLKA7_000203 [Drosophila subpalustris]
MTVPILYKLTFMYMVGYHVVGIINDLGPGNHKLWTNLGVSPEGGLKKPSSDFVDKIKTL